MTNRGFGIVFSDLPPGTETLEDVVDLYAKKAREGPLPLLWAKNELWKGYSTVGITAKSGVEHPLEVKTRLLIAGAQLVQQYACWTDGGFDEHVVDRFFNSLVIK